MYEQEQIDWVEIAPNLATCLLGDPVNKYGQDWRFDNKKNPALSVDIGKGVFTDHKTGESGGMVDLIMLVKGFGNKREAVEWVKGEFGLGNIPQISQSERQKRNSERQKKQAEAKKKHAALALQNWQEAKPLQGSLAAQYLKGRGLNVNQTGGLRFSPSCYHRKDESGQVIRYPAVIGAVAHWPEVEPSGVHRTYLSAEGQKLNAEGAQAKKMLGDCAGGAVRLSEASERLYLTEGIETALTVQNATGGAVWACLSTSGLMAVKLPPPDQVKFVVICADNDKAGREAAQKRGAQLVKEGYEVSIALPPTEGHDFNDLLQDAGIEAVQAAMKAAKPFNPDPAPKLLNGDGWPFFVSAKGVFFVGKDDEQTRLSSPLYVEAIMQDGEGGDWASLIAVVDKFGNRREVVARWSEITEKSNTVFARLANNGATIAQSRPLREKLAQYLLEARPSIDLVSANRIGWHLKTRAFVLPDKGYGGDPDRKVRYSPLSPINQSHPYQTQGTLSEWIENVALPCRGNSRLIFALCTALSGSFLRLAQAEGGVFHLAGASSTGKSTALEVAGSVWGGGHGRGFVRTWRTTDNALEKTLMEHTDTCLCIDELGQIEPHAAQRSIYMIAQGSGKVRANIAGDARPVNEWLVQALSSGELNIREKLAEGRGQYALKDGQEARFVEIPADTGAGLGLFEVIPSGAKPSAFAESLKLAARKYYGTAGRELVDRLANADWEEVQITVENQARTFHRKCLERQGAFASVDRAAMRFALVGVAGAWAAKNGILPFSKIEIAKAVQACFDAFLLARGGVGSSEVSEAKRTAIAFIEQFGQSRFQDWEYNSLQNIPSRAGFRKLLSDHLGDYEYYFLPEVFKKEIVGSKNFNVCVKGLVEEGFILAGSDRPARSLRVPALGNKSQRLYHITPEFEANQ